MRINLKTGLVAVLMGTLFLVTAGTYTSYGKRRPAADQQKVKALNDVYKNGLLSKQEYDAQLRELNQSGGEQIVGGPVATRMVHFPDPNLRMDFARMPVPVDWTFQGGLVQWTSCNHIVTEFYRATSPDGLSGIKELPRFEWAWADNGSYNPGPRTDCIAHGGPISADDFLHYTVSMLNLEYAQDMTNESGDGGGGWKSTGPNQHFDMARALTRFKINDIEEEEIMYVTIGCFDWPATRGMRGMFNHSCTAAVHLTWAPKGKLEATRRMALSTMRVEYNPAWMQLRATLTEQQTAAMVGQIIANGEAFRQAMDTRFQYHEQFMAMMQRGSDMNLNRFNQNMNTKQQMSDDWCDSILSQQKRLDPTTGQIDKTNSAFAYDWVNSGGRHLGSNDINFNPNGLGNGNWTLTTNIH